MSLRRKELVKIEAVDHKSDRDGVLLDVEQRCVELDVQVVLKLTVPCFTCASRRYFVRLAARRWRKCSDFVTSRASSSGWRRHIRRRIRAPMRNHFLSSRPAFHLLGLSQLLVHASADFPSRLSPTVGRCRVWRQPRQPVLTRTMTMPTTTLPILRVQALHAFGLSHSPLHVVKMIGHAASLHPGRTCMTRRHCGTFGHARLFGIDASAFWNVESDSLCSRSSS